MFTTFTDWEFTDIGAMEETGSNMWPKMQAVGALSFKAVQTGENTARTMIQWPDAATAQAAVDGLRAAAMDVDSSGNDVPKAIILKPITASGTPITEALTFAPCTRNSAPRPMANNPRARVA